MSDKTILSKAQRNMYSLLYAVVYITASLAGAGIIGEAQSSLPLLSPICYLVAILGLSSLLMSAGKRGLYVVILPLLALCIYAFSVGTPQNAVICAIDCISAAAVSAFIYFGYRKGERKSLICALGSAVALLFELATIAASVIFSALDSGVRFGTMLFESLDGMIRSYIDLYIELMENMANISPELYTQTPSVNTDLLYSSFILIITLLPAIIYCMHFAIIFLSCSLVDASNKKRGFIPDRRFEPYDIHGVTNVVFTIFGIILIFSLLFDSELSGSALGILSIVIAILPHFVIFGYRRIYRICVRLCGKGGAILLIAILSAVACVFAFQFFLCILAFFGTSEYRMAKLEKRMKR